MTIQITDNLLEQLCGSSADSLAGALRAVGPQGLGALAPWWLGPHAVEHLRRQPALLRRWELLRPPASLGSCWVLLANKATQRVLLGDAFLLPLRWQAGTEHSPHLPPGLRRLGDQVLDQFSGASGVNGNQWGLWLHDKAGLGDVDLSGLDDSAASWDSAWASLAGGLVLAAEGILPDPEVWASVAWDEAVGIGKVDSISAKVDLAARYGARHLFVSAENLTDALRRKQSESHSLEVQALLPVSSKPNPADCLLNYLGKLGQPPVKTDPPEKRRAFYQRANRQRADEYHWTHFLDEIVDKLSRDLHDNRPAFKPSHIVTAISQQRSVIVQGVLASGAKHALLLYEDDPGSKQIARWLQAVQSHLQEKGVSCTRGPIRLVDRETDLAAIRSHVEKFLACVPPGTTVFDLTPGYKFISLGLEELAREGTWLLYCRHRQLLPDLRPDPGSESYDCWQKK